MFRNLILKVVGGYFFHQNSILSVMKDIDKLLMFLLSGQIHMDAIATAVFLRSSMLARIR
jgi:hypothetical protein